MFFSGKVTTDKTVIQQWVEARKGFPAVQQKMSGSTVNETLRIGFPDCENAWELHEITWEEFFEKFDRDELAFLYHDLPAEDGKDQVYQFL